MSETAIVKWVGDQLELSESQPHSGERMMSKRNKNDVDLYQPINLAPSPVASLTE